MGASSSKQSSDSELRVWKGTPPTNVSQDIVESLQLSKETDTSRAQILELHVQARVAEELRRLQAKEAAALKEMQAQISSAEDDADNSKPSRQTVSKEIAALQARLEKRRKVRDFPESVEAARGEVVRCLRENDRRPLNCWREVEAFKEEVRRLEKGWVDRVVG